MTYGAVIFDFDGVIADTERLHYELYQEVLAPLGAGFSWNEYARKWMALHDAGCIEAVLEERGIEADELRIAQLVERKSERFEARLQDGRLQLFPGVAALIGALRQSDIPLAIASGALRWEVEKVLAAHGLRESFIAVIGAEDCERHKPEPEPYERALAALNLTRDDGALVPPDCVVLEDTPDGVRAAKAAGMMCVAVGHSHPQKRLSHADAFTEKLDGLTPEGIERLLRFE